MSAETKVTGTCEICGEFIPHHNHTPACPNRRVDQGGEIETSMSAETPRTAEATAKYLVGDINSAKVFKEMGKMERELNAAQAENAALKADAMRYRWLRDNINYNDEDRAASTSRTASVLTWRVRCWRHDSNDFVSTTIDAAIDGSAK